MDLFADVVGDALGELGEVELVPEEGHHHLLHEGAEVLEGVWVDVSAGHVVEDLEVSDVRGDRPLPPLHEEDALVPDERRLCDWIQVVLLLTHLRGVGHSVWIWS